MDKREAASGMNKEPEHSFSLEEVAYALFAQRGIKSGLWQFGAKLRFIGLTSKMPLPEGSEVSMPSGLVGIEGLALHAAKKPGELVFDAAKPMSSAPRKRSVSGALGVAKPQRLKQRAPKAG